MIKTYKRRRRPPKIIAGTLQRNRRPHRLAFRQPTTLSDVDGSGASFEHSIARVDAVWTAISAINHLDSVQRGVVKLALVVRHLKLKNFGEYDHSRLRICHVARMRLLET